MLWPTILTRDLVMLRSPYRYIGLYDHHVMADHINP